MRLLLSNSPFPFSHFHSLHSTSIQPLPLTTRPPLLLYLHRHSIPNGNLPARDQIRPNGDPRRRRRHSATTLASKQTLGCFRLRSRFFVVRNMHPRRSGRLHVVAPGLARLRTFVRGVSVRPGYGSSCRSRRVSFRASRGPSPAVHRWCRATTRSGFHRCCVDPRSTSSARWFASLRWKLSGPRKRQPSPRRCRCCRPRTACVSEHRIRVLPKQLAPALMKPQARTTQASSPALCHRMRTRRRANTRREETEQRHPSGP